MRSAEYSSAFAVAAAFFDSPGFPVESVSEIVTEVGSIAAAPGALDLMTVHTTWTIVPDRTPSSGVADSTGDVISTAGAIGESGAPPGESSAPPRLLVPPVFLPPELLPPVVLRPPMLGLPPVLSGRVWAWSVPPHAENRPTSPATPTTKRMFPILFASVAKPYFGGTALLARCQAMRPVANVEIR